MFINVKEMELRYQAACVSANIGLWDFRLPNEFWASAELVKMLNLPEYAYSLAQIKQLVHPGDFKDLELAVSNLIPNIPQRFQIRISVAGQSYRFFEVSMQMRVDDSGKPCSWSGTLQDIDHIKNPKIEDELTESISREKEMMEEIAHTTSHNLKSSAGKIQALLDLYEKAKDEPERRFFIEKVKTLSGNLNDTINQLGILLKTLHDSSQISQNILFANKIEKVLTSIDEEIYQSKAEIKIELEAENIHVPAAYLESIIHNLLTNAIKYRHPERVPQIRIHTYTKENQIILEVQDNGLGMDLNQFQKIFHIYQTYHKKANSSGVGLFLVQKQVKNMGGNIEVESELDKGTLFRITFPESATL